MRRARVSKAAAVLTVLAMLLAGISGVAMATAPNGHVPEVTVQPKNTAASVGNTAIFTVEYTAYPEASIQWQVSTNGGRKWSDITGANADIYTTPPAKRNMDGSLYRVSIVNTLGRVTSDVATLTVMPGEFTTADVTIVKECSGYDETTKIASWRITVTNDGPDTAAGVTVSDNLAKGTKFTAIEFEDGLSTSYKVRGSSVDVSVGELSSGGTASFTIYTEITRATLPLENTAAVTTTSYDPNPANNTGWAQLQASLPCASWAGTWYVHTGYYLGDPMDYEVTIEQTGSQVSLRIWGEDFAGIAEGDRLSMVAGDGTQLEMTMSSNGLSFEGTWTTQDDVTGPFNGTRLY